MNFKRRFVLLLVLGVTFSLTIFFVQVNLFVGALVAMVGVVVNYWSALIPHRKTITELQQRPT